MAQSRSAKKQGRTLLEKRRIKQEKRDALSSTRRKRELVRASVPHS